MGRTRRTSTPRPRWAGRCSTSWSAMVLSRCWPRRCRPRLPRVSGRSLTRSTGRVTSWWSATATTPNGGADLAPGSSWSEGWRRGWHDPPTVGCFHPSMEPARGAAAATRPVPSPRPDRQRRVQLDRYLRLRTASLSGRLGAGHEPQQSSSPRAAHRRVASTIVRGRSIGRCLEHRYITWPASRYGRRLRSPGHPSSHQAERIPGGTHH
jgi:hypothetical protein